MKIDFDGGEGKKYKSELQKHNDIKIMMEGCYLWFLDHFLFFFQENSETCAEEKSKRILKIVFLKFTKSQRP